jgi:trigger factor
LERTGLEPIDRAQVEDENLQEDGGFTFRAKVAVMPEVKIGEYRGLKAQKPSTEISEEAVDKELESLRQRFLTYVSQPERAVEKGDVVIIDYALEVEGKAVEEAGVSGYPLEVGTDSLFPQLNEGLLGAKAGEVRRVESQLPKTYPGSELAGKEATFVVTVKEVKVRTLPELNDEFASRIAKVENLEELRKRMRKSLERTAALLAEETLRERLINQVIEASETEPPQLLMERFIEARESDIRNELAQQGTDLEGYLSSRGSTYEGWRQRMEMEARHSLKRFLVMREIEKKEGIAVPDDEIKAEIVRLAEREQVSPAAKLEELEANGEIDDIVSHLRREKVMQLLVESAEVTLEEPAQEPPVQTEGHEHGKE